MNPCFLGIDTSNYTTSIAIVDLNGQVLLDKRIVLSVKPGELGLRQSDAFYQHVMNLPGLFFEVPQSLIDQLEWIAVSGRPRNVEGSYMPVFNAGVQFASVIGKSLNLPVHVVSHQDGHVMAGFEQVAAMKEGPYLNLHISGGTTEFFTSRWDLEKKLFNTTVVGGTKDISLGQLVDRIGVYMGLAFPSGRLMDELVKEKMPITPIKALKLPIKTEEGWFNLSGFENKLKVWIDQNYAPESVCYALFDQMGKLLYLSFRDLIEKHGPQGLVLAGGVMSNSIIRKHLEGLKAEFPNLDFVLIPQAYCTDNATGVARLARESWLCQEQEVK